jgi:hypothetical protein
MAVQILYSVQSYRAVTRHHRQHQDRHLTRSRSGRANFALDVNTGTDA